jgi:hypothetical protein
MSSKNIASINRAYGSLKPGTFPRSSAIYHLVLKSSSVPKFHGEACFTALTSSSRVPQQHHRKTLDKLSDREER